LALKAGQITRRFERAIKRHGILGALAAAPRAGWVSFHGLLPGRAGRARNHHESERRWDVEHGVETDGVVHPANLDACSDNWVHAVQYQPSDPALFNRALSSVALEHERFIFVDVGSGKGRGLVLAARYPFRRIIGVEFSRELHAIAERNVSGAGLDGRVELVCCDVLNLPLPDEPLAIYLYNPFEAEVMRPFVVNVERSLRDKPRAIRVFYSNPIHARIWDESALFRRAAEGHDGDGFVVWQSVQQAEN
jgi:SAM-dependent methyltransferase